MIQTRNADCKQYYLKGIHPVFQDVSVALKLLYTANELCEAKSDAASTTHTNHLVLAAVKTVMMSDRSSHAG